MLPFKRILFPVEHSEACREIVPSVIQMADHFQSNITLLHAVPVPIVFSGEMMPPEYLHPGTLENNAREWLREFANAMFPGRAVSMEVVINDAALAIRDYVHQQGTDLVMMPTRGYGIVRRMLLGSVTAKVLYDLSCPIWTGVHLRPTPNRQYRSIICALSLEEETVAIACAAAALAKSFGARLTLLHAVGVGTSRSTHDYSPFMTQLLEEGRAQLEDVRTKIGAAANLVVVEGAITECLKDTVNRHDGDLVVVGRGHDQEPVGRLWSHLYDILRESPVPVLSI